MKTNNKTYDLIMFAVSVCCIISMAVSAVIGCRELGGETLAEHGITNAFKLAFAFGIGGLLPPFITLFSRIKPEFAEKNVHFIGADMIPFCIIGFLIAALFLTGGVKSMNNGILLTLAAADLGIAVIVGLYYFFKHKFSAWESFSITITKVAASAVVSVILIIAFMIWFVVSLISAGAAQADFNEYLRYIRRYFW